MSIAPNNKHFRELLDRVRPDHDESPEPLILALDPGLTVGVCTMRGADLLSALQLQGTHLALYTLIASTHPDVAVCEDYHVYRTHASQHINSPLETVRLIGAIELTCALLGVPLRLQSAATAKGFSTDAKLKRWGMYQEGMRHANDAIRHAVYYTLWPHKLPQPTSRTTPLTTRKRT